jgi:hypothetical protein
MKRNNNTDKQYNVISNLLGIGDPFHCCHMGMGGGGSSYAPPADNSAAMILAFQDNAEQQERRFQAMEAARMGNMMEMETMRLVHEEKLRVQMKRADLAASRNLSEQQEEYAQEAGDIAEQQDVESDAGVGVDWLTSLLQGMGPGPSELYPD